MQKYRIKKARSEKLPASCSLMMGMGEPSAQVDPQGGKYGNGLIKAPAVITRGEALGHYFWIDAEMLGQVFSALTDAGTTGIKSRLGHPNWSDDKTGRGLGRLIGGQLDGDTVRAGGLHLSRAASKSPGGDLADWLLTQAVDDPEAIGLSIDFEHDYEAEIAFLEAHGAVWEKDELGRYLNLDEFQSPDPMNVDNLPHGRLSKLRAADVVDTPAANPAGLLSDDDQAAEVEQAVRYITGLSDDRPAEFLTLPADLLRDSLSEHLAQRKEETQTMADQLKEDRNNPAPKDDEQPEAQETAEQPEADEPQEQNEQPENQDAAEQPSEQPAQPAGDNTQLSAQALVKQYADRFGEKGMSYLSEGLSLEQSQVRFNKELKEQNEKLESRLAAVEAAGGSLGDEGVSHQPTGGTKITPKRNGLTGLAAALHTGLQAKRK